MKFRLKSVKLSKTITKKRLIIVVLAFIWLFDFSLFSYPASAKETSLFDIFSLGMLGLKIKTPELNYCEANQSVGHATTKISKTSPAVFLAKSDKAGAYKAKDLGYHYMTAYTSEVAQTDGDPCTTANGFNVCQHGVEDTVAANFLKFGTKVRIPDLFGDRIFVVRDRMNKRHADRLDVWMINKQEALKFGVKLARVEVIEE